MVTVLYQHNKYHDKFYRSTNEEKEQRINYAADQLAKGERSMVIVKKLAKKYSVSPQQARDYVREGRKVLTDSIAPNDRAFIFSKVMSCLEQDRLDARDQENLKEQGKGYRRDGQDGWDVNYH